MSEEKRVRFKWNGQEIEAIEGSNLLQAAIDSGIEVAHYCYHPGLSVAGVCRMCMIEQEGVPRIFPACNATVQEGISVSNNTPRIKEAVEWALQLHLVNHPLDCPVCDQAGECGLQEYYMEHGQYDSSMVDQKVHKKKVQDIGRGVMLDAERCILCSRCTRFTEEVTQTHELGIVNRGDHAEITAYKSLENDYALNLVDICPVGALTSQDFRFQQRVWFLEETQTSCPGCATGCAVKISHNEKGAFRVKPVFDAQVNGHWMCDEGRDIYKHLFRADRIQSPLTKEHNYYVPQGLSEIFDQIKKSNFTKIIFVLNGDHTDEEISAFSQVQQESGVEVYYYKKPQEGAAFDGILKRSEKNINLGGLENAYGEQKSFENLNLKEAKTLVVHFIPELLKNHDDYQKFLTIFSGAECMVGVACNEETYFSQFFDILLPAPSFLEKEGSYHNAEGVKRFFHQGAQGNESYTPSRTLSFLQKGVSSCS